jgi:hypothetical protein
MGLKVQVQSMSIRMPGRSVCERVCIAVVVMAVGGACEWSKENRVHGGVGYVVGVSVE